MSIWVDGGVLEIASSLEIVTCERKAQSCQTFSAFISSALRIWLKQISEIAILRFVHGLGLKRL